MISALAVVVIASTWASEIQQLKASENASLKRRVSITLTGQELSTALTRLAAVGDLTLWLDRRVDPTITTSIELRDLTIDDAFQKIAALHTLGYLRHGQIACVGPDATVRAIETLIREQARRASKVPAGRRKRWLTRQSVTWPRLTQPRTLVEEWLQSAGVTVEGIQQIPHDLWSARSLPPLTLVERLVLTLAGFGLTVEIESAGQACRIVPLELPTSELPLPATAAESRRSAAEPRGRSTAIEARRRYTLQLKNQPIGKVLSQLEHQLGLSIQWEPHKPADLSRRLVSCNVKEATLDELFGVLLGEANLRFQRAGNTIEITDRQ